MVRYKSGDKFMRSFNSRNSSIDSASSKGSKKTEVLVSKNRRKPRKNRVQREIRLLRISTKLIISKVSFSRVVRDVLVEIFPRSSIRRFQLIAFQALQEAAEMYLVQFFEDSLLLTYLARRVTLMQRDMVVLRRLRGRDDIINR